MACPRWTRGIVIVALSLSALLHAGGQPPPPTPSAKPQDAASFDITLDAAMRAEVIDGTLSALESAYVFPDVAEKMTAAIRARRQRKEYDAVTSGRQLAQLLTDHLREISRDKHLSVMVMPRLPRPPASPSGTPYTLEERQRIMAGRRNFMFNRVERLPGNVGYVDLRGFVPPRAGGPTATAAMGFLAHTDAIIFDLRENNGGDPAMVSFLTSYLFAPHVVHLNDFHSRLSKEVRQSWTSAHVPGPSLAEVDVYVLTSPRTVSGAEEFSYNLKHLKRATIVGETTAGAAHTVGPRQIKHGFVIQMPSGRPVNAVTGTNWEGVGVEPDVKVPADQALKIAHLIALEKQKAALIDDGFMLRNEITSAIESLRKDLGDAAAAVAPTMPGADSTSAAPASRAGDDFESGTLSNWRIDIRGSGGWFAYTNPKRPPANAPSDPNMPFDVPAPPQGKFAVITDQNAPGRYLLYRDVMLDGRYRLLVNVFYVNEGHFSGATTSQRQRINQEQQFRIDIVSPSAPLDSVAKEHVLATIFRAAAGDASRREPADVTLDLSPWAGQTVRLRVAVAENQAPLRAGIDHVRFEPLQP